ncbi:putative RNA-binding protein, partial [Gorgonomyces haynaldii]
MQQNITRLPPEVNRILFVRNLPFKVTNVELYDLFGKYGSIRQIRLGNAADTRGTAYVVYDDIFDAKNACEHLSGYNFQSRYLIVLYHDQNKAQNRKSAKQKEQELRDLK